MANETGKIVLTWDVSKVTTGWRSTCAGIFQKSQKKGSFIVYVHSERTSDATVSIRSPDIDQ